MQLFENTLTEILTVKSNTNIKLFSVKIIKKLQILSCVIVVTNEQYVYICIYVQIF